MAHYDIYQSLGLDRSTPTGELDRQLADRLEAVPQDDAAAVDELTTARAVVGNDTRRSLYDQRLDDPNAEDIDVASLKELAALQVDGPAGNGRQFQQQAGQFARNAGGKATVAGKQVQDSFRQSKGLAIGITAVVTAVVVLLVGWGIGALSGGSSGSKEDPEALALVDEMLDHTEADELRTWLRENSAYQYREGLMQAMEVGESGSASFSGMDALFSGSGLRAQTTLSMEQLAVMGASSDSDYESFGEDGFSEEEVDSRQIVGIVDSSGNYKANVAVIEQGGELKIFNVINASKIR